MRRNIQEPVQAEKAHLGNKSTVTTHPAFGQITVSKIQGTVELYGSDFTHHNFVNLSVYESELNRDLSRDWPFARRQLLSLNMSEAQWATFVSSFNQGSGVQCTLDYVNGESLPGLPPRKTFKLYADEAADSLKDALEKVRGLRAEMEAATSKLSKKMQGELLRPINGVISTLTSTLPFIKQSFDEHVETSIEKAKVEVNAYATNTIMRAGMTAIAGMPPLQLTDGEKT